MLSSSNNKQLSFDKALSQYLNFQMMTYATIEILHQIKYLQPFAMNILLFILPSLSFYFMSLTTMLSLLNF